MPAGTHHAHHHRISAAAGGHLTRADTERPGRGGTEPLTARSPLGPRLALSVWGEVVTIAATVVFVFTGHPGWAAVSAALWLLVTIDLVVVSVRLRAHRQPPSPWR
ncbi:DUF6343 family protein [Streptomyces sp. SPB074]|uniref:DUF6343 family protein n=1 Tax=Streptomyces sp. (strain SPB074) TaxID=465543 RepID=UPI0005699902|nr:DUF6343 family protein [Streptomyces sp. SPB074]